MIDKRNVIYDKCSRIEWDKMIKALDSGEVVKIDKSVYWYFLEVLPPIKIFGNDKNYSGFHFAEGMEHIKEFINIGNNYGVKQLRQINPLS